MTENTASKQTRYMLHKLGFSVGHMGYKVLCIAIPSYAQNSIQSVTKELYPSLRKQFGYSQSQYVERPIRYAISEAWEHGNRDVWNQYFPRSAKAPSNLIFIATMAEYLQ